MRKLDQRHRVPDNAVDPRDDDLRYSDQVVERHSFTSARLLETFLRALPSARISIEDLSHPSAVELKVVERAGEDLASQLDLLDMPLGGELARVLPVESDLDLFGALHGAKSYMDRPPATAHPGRLHSWSGYGDARIAYPEVLHVEVRDDEGELWRFATQDAEFKPVDPARLVGLVLEEAKVDPITAELRCDLSDESQLKVEPSTEEAADGYDRAQRDARWRAFCLQADRYVAETTRPAVRASQPA